MKLAYVVCALALLHTGCRTTKSPDQISQPAGSTTILQGVQRFVLDVSAPRTAEEALALLPARFSTRNEELQRRAGPLTSGQDLYLFPDGEYCYVQWADILPRTIWDRGHWSLDRGFVELKSDGSLPRSHEVRDRRLLLFLHEPNGKRTLLLMGAAEGYAYFRQNAKPPNDDLMLLICSFTKIEPIAPAQADEVRKKLYSESWKPGYFRK